MKKLLMALMAASVLLGGCTSKKTTDDYTGPVVTADTMSDSEKELQMIQSCISDYNNDAISDQEDLYQVSIPSLPIGITSLPEINSLSDLSEVKDSETNSNAIYVATYTIQDAYYATFTIYKATTGSFWLNGNITFNIDPDAVTSDNPDYASYKSSLDTLLAEDNDILNWLYGINVTLGTTEVEDGYYEVTAMGSYHPTSIDDIKTIAESVFTTDFLQNNYYQASFEGNSPVFKEINGKLCCVQTELTDRTYPVYDTSKIIAVSEDDTSINVDLLTKINNQDQTEIKRIVISKTENGYRLPQNY